MAGTWQSCKKCEDWNTSIGLNMSPLMASFDLILYQVTKILSILI